MEWIVNLFAGEREPRLGRITQFDHEAQRGNRG